MTIHGIEVNDNMDIKDIIALFNILVTTSGETAKSLSSSHERYKKLSLSETENIAKNEAILKTINALQINASELHEKSSSLLDEVDAKNKALLDEVEKRIENTMGGVSSHIKRAVHEAVKDVPVILDTDSLKDEMKHHLEVAFRDSNMGQTLQIMEAFGKVADRHIPKLTITVNEIEKVNAKLDKNSKNIQNMPAWINKATEEVKVAAKDLRENSQSIKKSVSSLNLALPTFTLIVGSLSTFIVLEYGDKIATLIKAGVGSLIG